MTASGDAVWAFVTGFYAQEGVSPACIALQDAHGADVDLALYLLHLAATCRVAAPAEIARLDALIQPWRMRVIAPLRQIRRDLKPLPGGYIHADSLRKSIATLEIDAERMQLDFLAQIALATRRAPSPSSAARANLAAYCGHLGAPHDAAAALLDLFDRHAARNETDG